MTIGPRATMVIVFKGGEACTVINCECSKAAEGDFGARFCFLFGETCFFFSDNTTDVRRRPSCCESQYVLRGAQSREFAQRLCSYGPAVADVAVCGFGRTSLRPRRDSFAGGVDSLTLLQLGTLRDQVNAKRGQPAAHYAQCCQHRVDRTTPFVEAAHWAAAEPLVA